MGVCVGVGVGVGPAPDIVMPYARGPVPAGPEPPVQFGTVGQLRSVIRVLFPTVKLLDEGLVKSGLRLYGLASLNPPPKLVGVVVQ